jgi:L-asparaginase
MRRLLVFTTGGTIASKYHKALGGYTTMVDGADLVAAVPGLGELAIVEVVELANVSSTYLTPPMVFGWAQRVAHELDGNDVAGAVVTHGTDTLEESAFLFDALLTTPKPVVFTGAMRTGSDLVTDGPRNLLSAGRVALHDEARERGVLVVLNDEVHTARDVTKTSSESLESFGSPTWGPVGLISRGGDGDAVTFRSPPHRSPALRTDRIEDRVAYVTTVLGSDGALIDAAVDHGARGLVIEAFGGGEVTPFMTDAVLRARELGVVVLVATRSCKGRPLDLYADLGEGKWLRDHGVLFSGYLSGPKARIALMLALGTGDESTAMRYFA